MMTRGDLDRAATHGCQVPDCDHQAHGEIWLHGRCHIHAPQFLSANRKNMAFLLVCVECRRMVATFAIGKSDFAGSFRSKHGLSMGIPDGVFGQNCHPESAVQASYRFGSGQVKLVCYECKAEVGTIDVEGHAAC